MITDWYITTGEIISNMMEEFLDRFYPESRQIPTGSGVRLNPCPSCGHNDCCTFSKGMVFCFSCEWSGYYASAYTKLAEARGVSKRKALIEIADFTGIKLPDSDNAEYERQSRIAEIRTLAADIYHSNLINSTQEFKNPKKGKSITAHQYLIYERHRTESTISAFKIGLSTGFYYVKNILIGEGFTEDEINEANLYMPESLLTYPQWCPFTSSVLRFNCKNPFGIEVKNKNNGTYVPPGWSAGNREKGFGFSPSFSFKLPIVIVEGENDAQALFQKGGTQSDNKGHNVCWMSGNPKAEHFDIFKHASEAIYTMMDNDEKGETYVEVVNDNIPDKKVLNIEYDKAYGDPDDYYNLCQSPLSIKELMDRAIPLKTDKFRITHKNRSWEITTRSKKLLFIMDYADKKRGIVGEAKLYKDGVLSDTKNDKDLTALPAAFKPLSLHLNEAIEAYYNSSDGLEQKDIDELCEIFNFSKYKKVISRAIAKKVHEGEYSYDDKEKTTAHIRSIIGQDALDEVLKDINDIQNNAVIENLNAIPTMKLSHYFNITNGDAYFYFTDIKSDADSVRRIPYFLRNDGETIRLDLLKKKDDQCLLLIDNKYELPQEIESAKFNSGECSLTHEWAKRYKAGEVSSDDLNPYQLVKKIEDYIRRFYLHTDENVYKVMALYIYGTYFYEMFGQYPYLFLNGAKGSGKTILDIVIYMFALNARLALHMSEAAMYRMISIDGGTIILDEIEYMTSRKSTQDSTMATILKGGYQRSGSAYRVNMDTASAEGFDVFCPKVISNIYGIEDVIEDRCIRIDTYKLGPKGGIKLEDPKHFLQEKMNEVKAVTSKCVLSALKHFSTLNDFYQNSHMITNNARLTQILTPILAVAKFVDTSKHNKTLENVNIIEAVEKDTGEYTSALIDFYHSNIARVKEDIEDGTPEGVLRHIISKIAHELVGNIDDGSVEYINEEAHKYRNKIKYDEASGDFEIDAIHIQVFMHESMQVRSEVSEVARVVKSVYNNIKVRRKTVKLDKSKEDLIKEFNGATQLKVQAFTFNVKDIIPNMNTFEKEDVEIDDPDLSEPF